MKRATERAVGDVQADITKARREVATLAGALAQLDDLRAGKAAVNAHGPAVAGRAGAGGRDERWTAAWRNVQRASVRGQSMLKGLAHGIERHPLLGSLAAHGVGFGIATLLFRRHPSDPGEGRE